MDRRQFVAMLVAGGSLCVTVESACTHGENNAGPSQESATPSTNQAGAPSPMVKPATAVSSPKATGTGNETKRQVPKPKPTLKPTNNPSPKVVPRSENPAGEYYTQCKNKHGKFVDCCLPGGKCGKECPDCP